jgi:ApbE superfamily uncharacterized protein (UPF0280 family)
MVVWPALGIFAHSCERCIFGCFDAAHPVSLRHGSRHGSGSSANIPRSFVLWESDYCTIFNSESATSCARGELNTNTLRCGGTIALTLVDRNMSAAAPAVRDAVGLEIVVMPVLGIRAHSLKFFIASIVWVDTAHPVALRHASRHGSGSGGTIPRSFVLGESNNCAVVDSESATTCARGVLNTNTLRCGGTIALTLVDRNISAAAPAVPDAVALEIVVMPVLGIRAHSLNLLPG